jgi:type II secretory pathway pseudopilin PulG
MKNIFRFLLRSQLQNNKQVQSQNGFTLIELLVAMIIAFLVITPLMGFMIDIMNTERREQVKATTEQEIQTALDYIAQELEQAVYIYDADGIYGNSTDGITGIRNQIPHQIPLSSENRVPVLAFWKRNFLNKEQNVTPNGTTGGPTTRVGCLVSLPGGGCNEQDYMVYSLVVYYLVQDNSPTWNPTTARIARWEIRDGIRDINGSQTRSETVNGITTDVKYVLLPDKGFMPFDLSLAGDLKKKLSNWIKHPTEAYTSQLNTLVDGIDQTTNVEGSPAPVCNTGEQQVPKYDAPNFPNKFKTGGFYVCVDAKKYVARIHIRGNALARIKPGAKYNVQQSIYFPTASIQIKGRGFLGVE